MILFLLVACTPSAKQVDVSHLQQEVDIQRFDRTLFGLDTSHLKKSLFQLREENPELFELYFTTILPIWNNNSEKIDLSDSVFLNDVKGLLSFEPLHKIYDTVQYVYSDLEDIEKEFSNAFAHLRYYFPTMKIPVVSSLISEFSYGVFLYEKDSTGGLGISLEMFLGENINYLIHNPRNTSFSDYLTRTYNRDHLVRKAIQVMIEDRFPPPQSGIFLDNFIYQGKMLYVLSHTLPSIQDSVLFEFSSDHIEWVKKNELEMWAHFLSLDILYLSSYANDVRYLQASPHTQGMPPEAPGRALTFNAYQVIKAYMKRHPEKSLSELMEITNGKIIFEAAKYKPYQ